MKNETKIGVVLGLNFAVERLFKKIKDIMHSEVISQHDMLPGLSDDMEAINELLEKQRNFIEDVGFDHIGKYGCKADLHETETPRD